MLALRPNWNSLSAIKHEARLVFAMGCQTQSHAGVRRGTLDMRLRLCLLWNAGCGCCLPAGRWRLLLALQSLAAACGPRAPTGSCLQSLSTHRQRCPANMGLSGTAEHPSHLSFLHRKEGNRLGRDLRMGEGSLYHFEEAGF